MALLLTALAGNTDEALARLAQAYDDHSLFLPFVNIDARFDAVRSDSRFKTPVRRMNFPLA